VTPRAIIVAQELLADRERVLGADHRDTLMTRHEVAYWRGCPATLRGHGRVRTAAGRAGAVLGPDHQDTLETRHELAMAGLRDVTTAIQDLTITTGRPRQVFGPEH
jgi:hypothetical protein